MVSNYDNVRTVLRFSKVNIDIKSVVSPFGITIELKLMKLSLSSDNECSISISVEKVVLHRVCTRFTPLH